MAKKQTSSTSNILLIGLIIAALWAGAATLMLFKMNKVSMSSKTIEKFEQPDLYSYASVYGDWTSYKIPNSAISFQYPPSLRIVETDASLSELNTKSKNIIPESAFELTFPEEIEQKLAETSGVLWIYKVKEPLGILTTLNAGGEIPEFVDISQHTEQFGKKNVWIVKAKYDDGPCAGSYYYRYVLPYGDEGNIVVEDSCASADIFSHSEIERFLSSFSE